MIPSFIETYFIKDKSLCDDLIKYHTDNVLYKADGRLGYDGKITLDHSLKESVDVTFHNDTNHKTIRKFFNILTEYASDYSNKYGVNNEVKTEYQNLISKFPPLGGFKMTHYERGSVHSSKRQLVYMLYLNDVTDGGGTEFTHQKMLIKAEKGKLVIWPADFTHTHRGVVSPTETKYITTGWFEISK